MIPLSSSAIPASLSQEELIARALAGDGHAFGELIRPFRTLFMSLALRILHCEAAAQDAVQEATLKILTSLQYYRPNKGSFSVWCGIIIRRSSIDHLRRLQAHDRCIERNRLELEGDPEVCFATNTPFEDRELYHQILTLMRDCVPKKQFECLSLSLLSGLSHRTIAAKLKIPLGTAKTRIELGGKKLRAALIIRGITPHH